MLATSILQLLPHIVKIICRKFVFAQKMLKVNLETLEKMTKENKMSQIVV